MNEVRQLTLGPTADASRLRLGLAFVLLTYFIVYGTLLWATNGLPYVLDNNETFSSIVHARNMLTHGIGQTFGLTDESVGLTSESNPYLYTHQGNFPRLFALLIYWLGARSAEAQIIVTTFTVGTAAIYFAYDVMARRAGAAIGVLFCILMMTDYIMVAQWQVNTWRVWHMFFFFLSLLCVDRAATTDRPQPWLALLLITHAALFYFELVFATFTAATTGFFAILTFRHRLRLIITSIAAQTAGMLLGIGILIAQLWAYFGWDDFVTDLKLTFLARNESLGAGSRAAAEQFMTEHKIAFWYNINEMIGLREPTVVMENYFSLTLGTYTPALVTIAAIVTMSILILRLTSLPFFHSILGSAFLPLKVQRIIIGGAFSVYGLVVIVGVGTSELSGGGIGPVETGLLGVLGLMTMSKLLNSGRNRAVYEHVPLSKIAPPAITLILAALWLIGTGQLFGPLTPYWGILKPIWSVISEKVGLFPLQLTLLLAGWVAARISAGAISPAVLPVVMRLSTLLTIFVSGLMAYTFVYLLSPGYIITGYLHRFVPLATFINLIPFSIGIATLVAVIYGDIVCLRLQPWWRAIWYPKKNGIRIRPQTHVAITEGIMLLASVSMITTILVYWATIQSTYFQRLPPDAYSFLSLLREAPFKGASFAVNTYAAPVAVTTGQWAYYDPILGNGRIENVDGKIRLARDLRYLWLADRETNPDYMTPEFFLCVTPRDMDTTIQPDIRNSSGCSQMPIVQKAGKTIPSVLTTELLARDESGRDRWAILRLNWHRAMPESPVPTSSNPLEKEVRPHD